MPVLEQSLWKYVNQEDSGWKAALAHGKALGHRQDPALSGYDVQEVRIRVKDLQRRGGASVVVEDDKVGPEDTLIRGYFFNRDLRSGLKLSCSNTKEEHAFTSSSVHDAGLSCMFFLQGRVGAHIGNHHIDFNAGANGDVICAAGALKQCSQPFKRVTKTPQYVRHLVVTASPDWLAKSGFEQYIGQNLSLRLNQQTIVSRQWNPSARLGRVIKEVFSPSVLVPELLDLHLEARTLDIVSETLTALMQSDGCLSAVTQLDRHSQIRVQRAKDFIIENPEQALGVEVIARHAGVSASGLQRLFHKAESCSVFDYVRQVRLNKAWELLVSGNSSVQEVSAMAGYKNPANFATAFKRRYGLTPSQVAI